MIHNIIDQHGFLIGIIFIWMPVKKYHNFYATEVNLRHKMFYRFYEKLVNLVCSKVMLVLDLTQGLHMSILLSKWTKSYNNLN
jgi:hypothetical protein